MNPGNAFPLISFERVMHDPLPPIAWLVEPLVAEGDRVVLFGEFGSMKSWVLLDLGLHIAAGVLWAGHFAVTQARPVLYVDEEMSEHTLRRRVQRLGRGAGFEAKSLPFHMVSQAGVRFDANGSHTLLMGVEAGGFVPEVVIVETLRRVIVGSENEAMDVGGFWRNVEPFRRAGKTLIISHHMRKPSQHGSNDSRYRASGSTDILAGADSAFAVQRLPADVLIIEHVKSRAAEEAVPFALRLKDDGPEGPVRLSFDGERAKHPSELGELSRAIELGIGLLRTLTPPTRTQDVVSFLESKGISRRTAERALPHLEAQGLVRRVRRGLWELVASAASGN